MADRGSPTQNHRDHVHVDTYRTGTPYVPRDGLAYLHEGEAVVPKWINSRAREFAGGASSGGGFGGVTLNLEGATITGMLELGGDGLARIVQGQIVGAVTTVNRGFAAQGVR
jgi:hypothetical protein